MRNCVTKNKPGIFLIFGFLMLIITIGLFLLLGWGFLKSLQTQEAYIWGGSITASVPKKFSEMTLQNYVSAFKVLKYSANGRNVYLLEMFKNSLFFALGCAILHTLTPCIVGYLTARYKVWFNKVIIFIVYFTMVFQVYGSMPSMIMTLGKLHLMNTWFGVFIMSTSFVGGGYLFFYAVFRALSKEYIEAAIIDGASQLTVMLKIAFPLCRTIIFVQLVSSFITYWNNYQTPMVYLYSYPTASYGLFLFTKATDSYTDYPNNKLAGFMLLLIPIVVLFLSTKKYLLGELTAGGVKE